MHTYEGKKDELANSDDFMSLERRGEIISRYGLLLEKCLTPVGVETDLPYSKEIIRKAIYDELSENPQSESRSFLEIAFVQLECFLPPEEFKVVHDFKRASAIAQQIAKSGDPRDIVASASILNKVKGEKAVRILEKISRKIRKRTSEIRDIGISALNSREC